MAASTVLGHSHPPILAAAATVFTTNTGLGPAAWALWPICPVPTAIACGIVIHCRDEQGADHGFALGPSLTLSLPHDPRPGPTLLSHSRGTRWNGRVGLPGDRQEGAGKVR